MDASLFWSLVSVAMLMSSCAVMTCAWYLHLRFAHEWSMPKAIFLSWLLAGVEYSVMVPANRIGDQLAGLSADDIRESRVVMLNTWRPIMAQPLQRFPLALCDCRSVRMPWPSRVVGLGCPFVVVDPWLLLPCA